MEKPIVSIIVPVYNVEKYLSQCLDSLVNQTLKNIEIICVNDGSKDHSDDILREYQRRDSRIRIINQQNKGLSGARNIGMTYVQGKYTMFVDSDDWIDLETCEVAVKTAEDNNADLVFWSYVREFDDTSKEKLLQWEDGMLFEKQQVCEQLHRRLCGLLEEELAYPDYANALETAWGKLYCSELLIKNTICFVDTKEIGTEDALFNLYAMGHVNRAVYVKRCFNHYRKTNQDSLTSNYKERLFSQWKCLFKKMDTYILENSLSIEYSKALNNRIALSLLGLGLNIVSSGFSLKKKIELINEILYDDQYICAYADLSFKYFPVHWKIFYGCAKYKMSIAVYIMLYLIKKIIYM